MNDDLFNEAEYYEPNLINKIYSYIYQKLVEIVDKQNGAYVRNKKVFNKGLKS